MRLTLWRDGKVRTVSATLEHPSPAPIFAPRPKNDAVMGMRLTSIPEADAHFGALTGVYVRNVDPGSLADEAGLRAGDIIVSAGRTPVASADELSRVVRGAKGVSVLLHFWRGNVTLFAALG